MQDALANIAVVLIIWLLFEAAVWLRERFRDGEDASVSLFCPYREERTPIASEHSEPVWKREMASTYEYRCEECGRIHCFTWGPPAPIYSGDKIRLRFTYE